MKRLICTVGLPRSGKSTWARSTGFPMVNPDSIRLAIHGQPFILQAEPFVWSIAQCMVRALFLAGHDTVVLDATNTTEDRRKTWRSPKEWTTYWKQFNTQVSECLARARNDSPLVEAIIRMHENWDPLGANEMRWIGPEDESL